MSWREGQQARCYILIQWTALEIGASLAVKNVSMSIPDAVAQGSTVTLRCDYDLEGQPLYSIKWFRGESEFYQYVPKEIPASKVFDVDGVKIKVDVSRSDANRVTLQDLGRQPPAYYRCEVSADAPTFHTGLQTGLLSVVVPPQRPPTIAVDKHRFTTGDHIRANCSVGPSFPAPNITWLVDDMPLSNLVGDFDESVLHEHAAGLDDERLQTLRATLRITGDRNKMVLGCQASLYSVYRQRSASVLLVSEGAPKPAPVRKAATSGASRTSGSGLSLFPLQFLTSRTSLVSFFGAVLVFRR